MKNHKYEDILNKFYQYLEGEGFVQDRFGNYKKIKIVGGEERLYRYKTCQNVVRYEIQRISEPTQYYPRSTRWFRLRSLNIKDIPAILEKIENKNK